MAKNNMKYYNNLSPYTMTEEELDVERRFLLYCLETEKFDRLLSSHRSQYSDDALIPITRIHLSSNYAHNIWKKYKLDHFRCQVKLKNLSTKGIIDVLKHYHNIDFDMPK